MGHRSRRHRKRFPCGHRGFGRFCHCCDPSWRKQAEPQSRRKAQRLNRKRSFDQDPIPLAHLPPQSVKKARQVIRAVQTGMNLIRLGGKRFHFDRAVISIPVGYRYRLLCRYGDEGILLLRVISHESYNRVANSKAKA